jgi:hypothetical protein
MIIVTGRKINMRIQIIELATGNIQSVEDYLVATSDGEVREIDTWSLEFTDRYGDDPRIEFCALEGGHNRYPSSQIVDARRYAIVTENYKPYFYFNKK